MHRYTLEPYHGPASRYTCPECNHKRTFSRYIDTQTNNHVADHVGRCSREDRCGYHFKPKEWLGGKSIVDSPWTMAKKGKRSIVDSPWTMGEKENRKYPSTPNYGPSTMDYGLFQKSLSNYHQNNFTNWLIRLFGEDVTGSLVSKYLIGTSKHWEGSTVFWQVDAQGGIRTGKIMLYSADGKRVKEPYNHINWVHALLHSGKKVGSEQLAVGSMDANETTANCKPATANFTLKQCLFGEHLLKETPLAPVAIVESEKSAIIASVYWPQFIWLAAGSLSNLNADKCGVLKGRNVTLFPDLNCFDKWEQKARELKLNFKTSALLETAANNHEREQGQDVADYLLKFDWQEFRGKAESVKEKAESQKVKAESQKQEAKDRQLPTDDCLLSKDCLLPPDSCLLPKDCQLPTDDCLLIDELEAYFNSIKLPEGPIRINKCSVISDVRLFIESNLVVVKRYPNKDWFRVYLDRLKWLKGYLEGAVGSYSKALEA